MSASMNEPLDPQIPIETNEEDPPVLVAQIQYGVSMTLLAQRKEARVSELEAQLTAKDRVIGEKDALIDRQKAELTELARIRGK